MLEEENEIEKKFHKFAERLRLGWQQLHPVKEKDLELARQAVREQWHKEQSLARESLKSQEGAQHRQAHDQTQEQGHDRALGQEQTKPEQDESQEQERRRER